MYMYVYVERLLARTDYMYMYVSNSVVGGWGQLYTCICTYTYTYTYMYMYLIA